VAAIGELARLYYGPSRSARSTGQGFRRFVHQRLKSFAEPRHAAILYEKYRNGLVHEARIKDGCQFEIGRTETLDISGIAPVIDPARLIIEIRAALNAIICELDKSQQFRTELALHIRREFEYELA
jgi:hypothetical protein